MALLRLLAHSIWQQLLGSLASSAALLAHTSHPCIQCHVMLHALRDSACAALLGAVDCMLAAVPATLALRAWLHWPLLPDTRPRATLAYLTAAYNAAFLLEFGALPRAHCPSGIACSCRLFTAASPALLGRPELAQVESAPAHAV